MSIPNISSTSTSTSTSTTTTTTTTTFGEIPQRGKEDFTSWGLHREMQLPLVPTASSIAISSSSSEDQAQLESEANLNSATNSSKSKKNKSQKRNRQPRFAFMTKTEIDNLEDGYRWRKYGQKAVKNSQYPRSYYRCTNTNCMVKKRVERSFQDPSVVITTYEGQHCHHSIPFSRCAAAYSRNSVRLSSPPLAPMLSQPLLQNNVNITSQTTTLQGEEHVSSLPEVSFSTDGGLLGDVVPASLRKRL